MDLQKMFDASMAQARNERLANSPTLLLGELKLKLELVKDKSKPIVFDFNDMKPAGVDSWRGSYQELAIEYSEQGGGRASFHDPDGKLDEAGWPMVKTIPLQEAPSTADFLKIITTVIDKTMEGYKGGDFKMHKGVAVYVSNYGESSVPGYKGSDWATVSVTDVAEGEDMVVIVTAETEY